MCGIAGFSVSDDRAVDASVLVRALIAGLAERGEDACGYGYRDHDGSITVVKDHMPPLQFLTEHAIRIPPTARDVLVHVRDHTKGVPSHVGNNHPLYYGSFVGVHNGIIQNDDALFDEMRAERAVEGATVDSEAIFMLLDRMNSPKAAFERLIGSYSIGYMDRGEDRGLWVVRGQGRPLVTTTGRGIALFASTSHALEYVELATGIRLRKPQSMRPGTMRHVVDGSFGESHRIAVQPFTENQTTAYEADVDHAVSARSSALEQIKRAQRSA